MLLGVKTVHYVRRLVEYRGTGKRHHNKCKDIPERKTKESTCDYKSQGGKTADRQDRREPREIGPRNKDRERQPGEKP